MLKTSDPYTVYAYEMGFAHGARGDIERPIKGQADPAYILGFNTAQNLR